MQTRETHTSGTSFLKRCAGPLCIYFLLLNLTSGLTYLKYFPGADTTATIIALCGLIAFVASAACESLRRWRLPFVTAVAAFTLLFNLMIGLDYFMLLNFHEIFNQDAMDVIADTNPAEARGFLRTYLTIGKTVMYLSAIAAYNIAIWKLAQLPFPTYRRLSVRILYTISILGLLTVAYCGYHYVKYGNGIGIPQCSTTTRVLYSIKISRDNLKIQDDILRECQLAQATTTLPADSLPDIIVIIGESHSVFHSQLYGYSKATEPRMSEIADGLTIYRDAITPWDITVRAMQAIFSTADVSGRLQKAPLFPALFKKAGYHTVMYDNQYTVGKGISLLSDPQLSAAMFDERNTRLYPHDSELIETISHIPAPTLYVIHLYGQHYPYADRYTPRFNAFTKDDYADSIPETYRETIALYDNATLSTDHNLRTIIEKFRHDECAIIYLSDHGEEVFDYSDKKGHCFAADAGIIDYQLRIPLWIWLSPAYRRHHPDLTRQVAQASQLPVSSNDISHVILRLGLIDTPHIDPSRCFIDTTYDRHRRRTVLTTIDFDSRSKRIPAYNHPADRH